MDERKKRLEKFKQLRLKQHEGIKYRNYNPDTKQQVTSFDKADDTEDLVKKAGEESKKVDKEYKKMLENDDVDDLDDEDDETIKEYDEDMKDSLDLLHARTEEKIRQMAAN